MGHNQSANNSRVVPVDLLEKDSSKEEPNEAQQATIKALMEENLQLKKTLDEHQKRNRGIEKLDYDPELQAFLRLYKELPKLKCKIEEIKENICNNQNDYEVEELKRENVRLYVELKEHYRNRQVSIENSRKLKELEKQLLIRKDVIGRKVMASLEKIQEKMSGATMKFANRLERAILEMETILSKSKEQLGSIEDELEKGNSCRLIYEEIKNILLEQKSLLKKELTTSNQSECSYQASNIKQDPPNSSSATVQNNLASNVNVMETDGEEGNENKIIIFYAPEDADDKTKAQAILKNLTQLKLDNIKVYRLGKVGDRARPMIVVFENKKYVNEVLQSRFSLNNTEFKGIKVVKYKKANENKKLLKNIEADETNPLVAGNRIADVSGSEEGNEDGEEGKPYKIVLFYVAEDGNDYDKVMAILMELTKMPLINIGVSRLGNKSDAKIRPLVVSFDSQKYVTDALKNRYSLKDTLFKGTKVVKYNNPSQQKETKNVDIFPF